MDDFLLTLPLISRASHPSLHRRLDSLLAGGHLVPVLRGVYRWAHVEEDLRLRASAVTLARPDAVLLGPTAAALTWWPGLPCRTVHSTARWQGATPSWLRTHRAKVPEDLVMQVGDVRVATPALSLLGMVDSHGVNPICVALRKDAVTLGRLWDAMALLRHAEGSPLRRSVLRACRDRPWSPLEVEAHALLRSAGFTGWNANHQVSVVGRKVHPDVAFPRLRIAVEFDGFTYHGDREAFERDRERHNLLVAAGWIVLRFTSRTLETLPELLGAVVRQRTHELGIR